MFQRIIWIILDSVGIGAMPDSEMFGDEGADTLGHIFESIKGFDLPNLRQLGLGNIDGVNNIDSVVCPIGIYGKASEQSNGKDTTVGHWEMTGIYTRDKFPVFENGFPDEVIDKFIKFSNIPGILCNKAASGTEVLKEYGKEHIKTGKPIVYTSADSVFQIACHEDVYPLDELYQLCRNAREILTGKYKVARVIARPFIGDDNNFVRTSNRKDFSVEPEDNLLTKLNANGIDVYGVGKIHDIFCGKGVTKSIHTNDNMDGVNQTLQLMKQIEKGLIFTNLVEFDSKWGHRRDVQGYAKGLIDFDIRLREIMNCLKDNDLLIVNADHGCDPTYQGTDHTREYIPVLMYGKKAGKNVNLHILQSFADIGQTIADNFGCQIQMGNSKLKEIVGERECANKCI